MATKPTSSAANTSSMPILSIIVILLIYCIYNYARSLDNCNCVNKSIINNIKNVELFLLIILSISFIIRLIFGRVNIKNLIMTNSTLKYVFGCYMAGMVWVYAYLVYEVYNLKQHLPPNCDCADKWQLDLLYGQAIFYLIIIVSLFISLGILGLLRIRYLGTLTK